MSPKTKAAPPEDGIYETSRRNAALFNPFPRVLEHVGQLFASVNLLLLFSRFRCIHEASMEPCGIDSRPLISQLIRDFPSRKRGQGAKTVRFAFSNFPYRPASTGQAPLPKSFLIHRHGLDGG